MPFLSLINESLVDFSVDFDIIIIIGSVRNFAKIEPGCSLMHGGGYGTFIGENL